MTSLSSDSWKIEAVAGIIFDKDGTLIDSHVYWGEIVRRRAAALAAKLGGGASLRGGLTLAMGYDENSRKLLPEGPVALKSRDEVIKAVSDFLRGDGLAMKESEVSGVFSCVHAEFAGEMSVYLKVLPGAAELLASIQAKKIPCALVTSDSAASSAAILKHLGFSDFFSVVLGRESCPLPKESGRPGLIAAERMGLPPDSVVCVGDAPMDILMAEKAGLRGAVAVATGQVPIETLRALTPYAADALTDLKVGE